MKMSRFFISVFCFIGINGCGPDTSAPTEEEESAYMIDSRLEFMRAEVMRKQGLINFEKCRSGLRVPDAVSAKVIALTFDDGPNPATTNKILDVLKTRGVKATFFTLGIKAKANPEILKRMIGEGHLVASHSQTHKNFGFINSAQTIYEIRTPNAILAPYFGKGSFFRYPYGKSSCAGNELLDSMKYQPAVGWHIDTCDWAMTDGYFSESEAEVCYGDAGAVNYQEHVMEKINESGGGIALFHDIHAVTANNLDSLIGKLVAAKYKFVRVDNKTYFPKLNVNLFMNSKPGKAPEEAKELRTRSQSLEHNF